MQLVPHFFVFLLSTGMLFLVAGRGDRSCVVIFLWKVSSVRNVDVYEPSSNREVNIVEWAQCAG